MAGSTTTLTLTVVLCLELCRGPWDQVQAGIPPKPSIWAEPGPVISKGSPVTIWCQGSLQADGYLLYKERGSEPWMTSVPETSSKKIRFLIESMRSQNVGLYQCAYSTGGSLSELSEPLLLVVTGEHSQPSLSAQPSPVVASGGNVSLLCSSQSTGDTFHLLKEGGAEPPQHRKSEWRSNERRWQAVFPVGRVSSSHGGTYRCYGSNSSTPNVWSQPSDPLHLEVTGLQLPLTALIGVSVALVLLLSLLLFLFLHHQRQSKGRTSHAAMKDSQPGEGMEPDPQNGPNDNPKEVTYTQVNFRSRLRQGMAASSSSRSEELLDTKGRQAAEDRQMNSQAAASADPQDVTYVQLNLMSLRRETTAPPSSPSQEPPDEPSVYAALAVP